MALFGDGEENNLNPNPPRTFGEPASPHHSPIMRRRRAPDSILTAQPYHNAQENKNKGKGKGVKPTVLAGPLWFPSSLFGAMSPNKEYKGLPPAESSSHWAERDPPLIRAGMDAASARTPTPAAALFQRPTQTQYPPTQQSANPLYGTIGVGSAQATSTPNPIFGRDPMIEIARLRQLVELQDRTCDILAARVGRVEKRVSDLWGPWIELPADVVRKLTSRVRNLTARLEEMGYYEEDEEGADYLVNEICAQNEEALEDMGATIDSALRLG